MVDLRRIELPNLTDANRALSQLSYRPSSKQRLLASLILFEKKLRL